MFALNQAPTLDEPWLQFKNLQVRQLAFCLSSPNILQSIPSELRFKQHTFQLHSQYTWAIHFKNYHARLLYLDQHPQELELFLQRLKSTRLGLRFEMFIWFWLLDHAYHPYQVLGHSIQKIVARQTIGELDFLLLNHENNQVEHWEVALKYYLAETDYTLPCWYGLNRSDQLIRKLNHFSQQQFQFDEALEQTIEQRFVVLKGQLYLPLQHRLRPCQIGSIKSDVWAIGVALFLPIMRSFIVCTAKSGFAPLTPPPVSLHIGGSTGYIDNTINPIIICLEIRRCFYKTLKVRLIRKAYLYNN